MFTLIRDVMGIPKEMRGAKSDDSIRYVVNDK